MLTVKSEENLYGLSKSADYDPEKTRGRVCNTLAPKKSTGWFRDQSRMLESSVH
jgi:hypothetical protein